MAKAKNRMQASLDIIQEVAGAPSVDQPMEADLREFALTVGGSRLRSDELAGLKEGARGLKDPALVRTFLTRALERAACFAVGHEVYWPLVKKTLEAGR